MRPFLIALAVLLAGCDPALTDPTVARLDAVTVETPPDDLDGRPFIVRLSVTSGTSARTQATAPTAGSFPSRLELAPTVDIVATDGLFDGDLAFVEIQRCDDAACESVSQGDITQIGPDAWRGSTRTVEVGGARLTFHFQRTTS